MRIFIPTRSRFDEQPTYSQLTAAGLSPTLVVDTDQIEGYEQFKHSMAVNEERGIVGVRNTILKLAGEDKFAMIDDDIVFRRVRRENGCRIVDGDAEFIKEQFALIDRLLDTFAHGSVHPRQFVHTKSQPYVTNRGYYWQVILCNPRLISAPIPRFRGRTGEDLQFQIDLVMRGLDWFTITSMIKTNVWSRAIRSHFDDEEKERDAEQIRGTLREQNPKFVRGSTIMMNRVLREVQSRG